MLFVLITVLAISLAITGINSYAKQRDLLWEETRKKGEDIAFLASESVSVLVANYNYHSIDIVLDKLIRSSAISYIVAISENGNKMSSAGTYNETADKLFTFSKPMVIDDRTVGTLNVQLDSAPILAHLERQRNDLLLREILMVLIAAIGEYIALSILILKPMVRISNAITNNVNEEGIITKDIRIDNRDEFGVLANQYNSMKHHLNIASRRLKQRVDAADEELIKTNEQLLTQQEELSRVNCELRRLSITDPLTNMKNRRYFEEFVETEIAMSIRHGQVNSLCIIDIDHFKSVNDTYGHASGDKVLKDVAAIISSNIRRSDVCCRIGGEEFVVLFRQAGKEASLIAAEKLRNAIASHQFNLGRSNITVTCSLGCATIDGDVIEPTFDHYFTQADNAMYHSKENGRNRVTHHHMIESITDTSIENGSQVV